MARITIAEAVKQKEQLELTVTDLRYQLKQRDQDFITLEKGYEAGLVELKKLKDDFDVACEQRNVYIESLAKLQKEHDSHKSMREHYSREHDKAVAEIESVHAVLDSVEGAPTRTYELNEYNRDVKRSTVTRLAGAFLAIVRK